MNASHLIFVTRFFVLYRIKFYFHLSNFITAILINYKKNNFHIFECFILNLFNK